VSSTSVIFKVFDEKFNRNWRKNPPSNSLCIYLIIYFATSLYLTKTVAALSLKNPTIPSQGNSNLLTRQQFRKKILKIIIICFFLHRNQFQNFHHLEILIDTSHTNSKTPNACNVCNIITFSLNCHEIFTFFWICSMFHALIKGTNFFKRTNKCIWYSWFIASRYNIWKLLTRYSSVG